MQRIPWPFLGTAYTLHLFALEPDFFRYLDPRAGARRRARSPLLTHRSRDPFPGALQNVTWLSVSSPLTPATCVRVYGTRGQQFCGFSQHEHPVLLVSPPRPSSVPRCRACIDRSCVPNPEIGVGFTSLFRGFQPRSWHSPPPDGSERIRTQHARFTSFPHPASLGAGVWQSELRNVDAGPSPAQRRPRGASPSSGSFACYPSLCVSLSIGPLPSSSVVPTRHTGRLVRGTAHVPSLRRRA
jgi:hypothetical protein